MFTAHQKNKDMILLQVFPNGSRHYTELNKNFIHIDTLCDEFDNFGRLKFGDGWEHFKKGCNGFLIHDAGSKITDISHPSSYYLLNADKTIFARLDDPNGLSADWYKETELNRQTLKEARDIHDKIKAGN